MPVPFPKRPFPWPATEPTRKPVDPVNRFDVDSAASSAQSAVCRGLRLTAAPFRRRIDHWIEETHRERVAVGGAAAAGGVLRG